MAIVQCKFCGKDVEKSEKVIKKFSYFFCNKKCQLKFISSTSTTTIEKCATCGKDVKRNNAQKRRSKTGIYFCNIYCRNIYTSKISRWKQNPYDFRGRREEVLKVSNYCCQKCGYHEDKRMLDVHHYDENHHNNKWNNLRCVCNWCHMKHHRKVELIGYLPALFPDDIKKEENFKMKKEESIRIKNEEKIKKISMKISNIDPEWNRRPRPNSRKVIRPAKEELKKMVWEKSTLQLSKNFGVSSVAIAKWCKSYGITKPTRGYWAKQRALTTGQ